MIRVSVIIPNFNKGRFIAETLNSLRNQTYDNWEVIIVDDLSTDSSIEIIKEYVVKDKRYKYFIRDTEPKGGAMCRNIGLYKANGDYVIFLDSDDIVLPTFIEERVRAFSEPANQHNDFLLFQVGTFKKKLGDCNSVWIPKKENALENFLKHNLPWNVMSPIWRKEVLLKLKGFNVSYERMQDVELHTRALLTKSIKYDIVRSSSKAFYRIDNDRQIYSEFQLLEKTIISTFKYVSDMKININNSDFSNKRKRKLMKCLKVTVLTTLTNILYNYSVGRIAKTEKIILYKLLLEKLNGHFFISNIDVQFLKIYYFMNVSLKMSKIKGFNYISRFLISKF